MHRAPALCYNAPSTSSQLVIIPLATPSTNEGAFGRCIFCGDLKNFTQEHIWPKWLRPHIDFGLTGFGKASIDVFPDREEIISVEEHRGDPRKQPITRVCADCNNRWMSQLQERAKSHLLPMIQSQRHTLDDAAQRIVAAWVSMAIMTGEFFFDAVAVAAVDRLNLKLTSSPLPNWKVWAGSYVRGDWQGHFAHATRPIIFPDDPETPVGEALPRNTQSTSFVVGNAYFHAFSCPSVFFTDNMFIDTPSGELVQIWPVLGPLSWPTPVLTDLQADRMASFIFNAIDGRASRSIELPTRQTKDAKTQPPR